MLIEADNPLYQSLLWQIQNNYSHTAVAVDAAGNEAESTAVEACVDE